MNEDVGEKLGFGFAFLTKASKTLTLAVDSEEERMAWTGCIRTASFGQPFVAAPMKNRGTSGSPRPKSSQLDDQRTSFARRSQNLMDDGFWEHVSQFSLNQRSPASVDGISKLAGDSSPLPLQGSQSGATLSIANSLTTSVSSDHAPSPSYSMLTPSPSSSSPSPIPKGHDNLQRHQSKASKLAQFLRRSVSEKNPEKKDKDKDKEEESECLFFLFLLFLVTD